MFLSACWSVTDICLISPSVVVCCAADCLDARDESWEMRRSFPPFIKSPSASFSFAPLILPSALSFCLTTDVMFLSSSLVFHVCSFPFYTLLGLNRETLWAQSCSFLRWLVKSDIVFFKISSTINVWVNAAKSISKHILVLNFCRIKC